MVLENTKAVPMLVVTDLKQAKEFYGGTLGFEEVQHSMLREDEAAYRVGDDSYLGLYERSEPSGSTATACVFPVKDVEQAVRALRERGVEFEEYDNPEMGIKTVDGIATMDNVKTAWFKDPSGNILAIDNLHAILTS